MEIETTFSMLKWTNRSPETLQPERTIIEQAQSGDLDALGQLYNSHVNQVYRYSLARLRNIHDAEDVTGDVFLKMLNGLPEYELRDIPFAAWIMRISRNEVIQFVRKNRRHAKDGELSEELTDNKADVENDVIRRLELERIKIAVAQLPEAQREVIILRFAAGLSIADTARNLGKNENNVRVTQSKAMLKLRHILGIEPDPQKITTRLQTVDKGQSRIFRVLELIKTLPQEERIRVQDISSQLSLNYVSVVQAIRDLRDRYGVKINSTGDGYYMDNETKKKLDKQSPTPSVG